MLAEQGASLISYAHYTNSGSGATGLTVTVDVYEVTRDGTATLIVDDGACTEVGGGLYRYLLAAGSVDAAAEYVFLFTTAGTVDQADLPALWIIDRPVFADVMTIEGTDATDVLGTAQTGDSFARLGAPAGASVSADIAAVQADTDDVQTRLPAALVSGRMDSSVGAMAANVLTATAIASDAITAAKIATDAIGASELATDALGSLELASSAVNEIVAALVAAGYSVVASDTTTATEIDRRRGDTWSIPFTSLGDLTGWAKIWFTVKKGEGDPDSESILQIAVTTVAEGVAANGLSVVNGAAYATASDGTVTVSDESAGDLTVAVAAAVTDDLKVQGGLQFDVQWKDANGDIHTIADGTFEVISDVTKAVS